MWARLARFEGDPAGLDERIERLRAFVAAGVPDELAGAELLMLVDRTSGAALGLTLFETEEQMRRADALMSGGPGHGGGRTGVEFYEVPVSTL